MSKTLLSLTGLNKFYGSETSGVHAVKQLDLEVQEGEIVALLGSSGCGKTTTLRMIAGFEEVSSGTISIDDREIHRLAPVERNVAMAFEGYSLYPPLTVRDNIAFGLKSARLSAAEVESRVTEVVQMLEIEDILDRLPSSISGGQQQRASLGRALIRSARLHVLDEPMGQLEPQLRALLRGRIKHFIKERSLTAILVTHDQTEANALADRIAVMEDGELQQYDTPLQIKERPSNLFTGTFIGEPPMNVFDARVSLEADTLSLALGGDVTLTYPADAFSAQIRSTILSRPSVVIGIRPYAVKRSDHGVSARVVANQWLGDQSHIAAEFASQSLVLVEHARTGISPGDDITIDIDPSSLHIFDASSGAALSHGTELVA